MLSNDIVERGQRGYTPALTTRADEALLDYISDMRNQLMHSPHRRVEQQSAEALKHHGLT